MSLLGTAATPLVMDALTTRARGTLPGNGYDSPRTRPIRVYVISPMRIYREGLIQVLATRPGLTVAGSADTFETALPAVRRGEADVALYDLRCSSGLSGLRRLAETPAVTVVGLGVEETVECILACAEAGMAGYVTDTASVDELASRVGDAARGELHCPPHIAASLVRRLAAVGAGPASPEAGLGLTSREREVAALLQQGLSNKQIAHRLTIQLATVKNHVHSILTKLEAPTRGDAAAVLRARRVGVSAPAAARPWPA
ncbi:response regulator transcription factor [Nocardioides albidus]|uniref:Response regulator transcription factor n=1 Tax=Nocardioides albidus TaxID=1517589 RepID=A0A5C4WDG3_9ACTN|nr:response regulator transcription factor [Nocardioides albidus]TNM46103.1 response regulator transcription factor [Nocardioides albidus]